jgi:hypothetical protein
MNSINLNSPAYNSSIRRQQNPAFSSMNEGLTLAQRAFKTGVREFCKTVPAAAAGYAIGDEQGAFCAVYASKLALDVVGMFRSEGGTSKYVSELNLGKLLGDTIPAGYKKLANTQFGQKIKKIADKISTKF